jgi:glycosyltransferase involved in cell wall biosynthesis
MFHKIVIVTNSIGGGGAERSMNLLANQLTKMGAAVYLVPINNGVNDIVTSISDVLPLNRSRESGLILTISKLIEFRRLVVGLNGGFIILNCDLPELFGLFLPLKMNLVIVEHSNPAWTTRRIFGRIVRKLHFLRRTRFFAVSSHLNIWPFKIQPEAIVNNMIHLSLAKTEIKSGEAPISRLVFVGRLAEPQKRVSWLIEIASKSELPVLFIGQGDDQDFLKSKCISLNVSAEFVGHRVDPWDSFIQGDVLIVPSLFEGDGLVVVEALAKRIPIIISNIPAFRRFDLPQKFYASSQEEFIERLKFYQNNANELVVPWESTEAILLERDPSRIATAWLTALDKIPLN